MNYTMIVVEYPDGLTKEDWKPILKAIQESVAPFQSTARMPTLNELHEYHDFAMSHLPSRKHEA